MECKPWRMPNLRPVPESPPRIRLLTGPCAEQPHESSSPEGHAAPGTCQRQACADGGQGCAHLQSSAFVGGEGRTWGGHTALWTTATQPASLWTPGTHNVQVAKLEMNWALRTSFRRENKTPHRKHVVHTVVTDTQKGSALLFRETQIRAAIRYLFTQPTGNN